MNQTFVLRDQTAYKRLLAFLEANWLACAQNLRPLSVTVAEHKAKRNNDQNRLYWAVLREIAGNAWVGGRQFSDENWHEHFKRLFIGVNDYVLPSGEVVYTGISTTTLSVPAFAEYIDKIQQYAVEELGIEFDYQPL